MNAPAPTSRWLGAGFGRSALWLAACWCCGASAQMLAPNPSPEVPDAPAPKRSIAVRTVPLPGGLMLERTDVPPEPVTASRALRSDQGAESKGRYRTIVTPSGQRVLEATDATPAPVTGAMDPSRLVEQTGAAGERILGLRDETPPPQRARPPMRIVDIPAEPREAPIALEPQPNVLYRVVKPSGGS
jgi:hypothetical protein